MSHINQLDVQNERLVQAAYLFPDLNTVISEITKHILLADEQNGFASLSNVSLNVDISGINITITTNQDFWSAECLNTEFFSKKETLFYFLHVMAENVTIKTKAKSNRHQWTLSSDGSLEIDNNTVLWQREEYGIFIEIKNLFCKLPVRNAHFLKEFDKSLVLLETEIKNTIMFYQSIYQQNKSVIEFVFSKDLKQVVLKKQSWDFTNNNIELLKRNFESLFVPQKKLDMMDCVKIKVDNKYYTVEGFITAKGYPSQRYQLVYFNKRQLELPKRWVRTYFNDLFSQQYGFSSSTQYSAKTVGNAHRTYPIIVLRIQTKLANQEENDLAESNQRFSRFSELRESHNPKSIRILVILETIINQFLKKLNLSDDKKEVDTEHKNYFDFFANRESSVDIKTKNKIVISSNAKDSEQSLLENFQTHKSNISENISSATKYPKNFLKNLEKPLTKGKPHIIERTLDVVSFPEKISVNVSALETCRVVGQVDKKFILTSLGNGTILIFDQHAMDERIKLEQFIKEYLYSVKEDTVAKDVVEIPLGDLSDLEKSLIGKYSNPLLQLGFLIQIKENDSFHLAQVPSMLFKKLSKDHKYILDGIWKHIFDLEDMNKKGIDAKKISIDSWWSQGFGIPSIIMDILKSNSCRQALMFGDEIEKVKCQELIMSLKLCNVPFFCAHGRPSMYPFVYKTNPNPSFTSDYIL